MPLLGCDVPVLICGSRGFLCVLRFVTNSWISDEYDYASVLLRHCGHAELSCARFLTVFLLLSLFWCLFVLLLVVWVFRIV